MEVKRVIERYCPYQQQNVAVEQVINHQGTQERCLHGGDCRQRGNRFCSTVEPSKPHTTR